MVRFKTQLWDLQSLHQLLPFLPASLQRQLCRRLVPRQAGRFSGIDMATSRCRGIGGGRTCCPLANNSAKKDSYKKRDHKIEFVTEFSSSTSAWYDGVKTVILCRLMEQYLKKCFTLSATSNGVEVDPHLQQRFCKQHNERQEKHEKFVKWTVQT